MNESSDPSLQTSSSIPYSSTSSDTSSVLDKKLPDNFPVSVLMEARPAKSQWIDKTWTAVGLLSLALDEDPENSLESKVKIIQQGEVDQLLYGGLKIRLFLDECESYYHNLMSPEPGCFVVARVDDEAEDEGEEGGESTDEIPIPFMVTLSFDEAHAYLEGDDIVYSVPIPPELYRWAEAYIVENYSAEKRRKRKRKDWRKGE